MRKSKINHIYDLLYYAFFMIVPIAAYLLRQIHATETITLITFFNEFGIDSSNIVFQSFVDIFGSTGFLPLISDTSTVFYMFTYMAIIVFMHLVFDLLVFLPKLAHHYLNAYTKECEQ